MGELKANDEGNDRSFPSSDDTLEVDMSGNSGSRVTCSEGGTSVVPLMIGGVD